MNLDSQVVDELVGRQRVGLDGYELVLERPLRVQVLEGNHCLSGDPLVVIRKWAVQVRRSNDDRTNKTEKDGG